MAISIYKRPDVYPISNYPAADTYRGYYYAHNPLIITLQPDSLGGTGERAQLQIGMGLASAVAGCTFTILGQTFLCANPSGTNQFRPSPPFSVDQVGSDIANAINTNAVLSNQIEAFYDPVFQILFVRALYIDADLLTISASTSGWTVAPGIFSIPADPLNDAETFNYYSGYVRLFLNGSSYPIQPDLEKQYNADNTLIPFDVGQFAKNFVTPSKPVFPTQTAPTPNAIQLAATHLAYFVFAFGESTSQSSSNAPVKEPADYQYITDRYYVLLGNSAIVSTIDFPDEIPTLDDQPQTSLVPYFRSGSGNIAPQYGLVNPLSLRGERTFRKTVYPNAPELLYFIYNHPRLSSPDNTAFLFVRITAVFYDLTTQDIDYGVLQVNLVEGVYYADISPTRWDYKTVETGAGKKILYYTATIYERYGSGEIPPNYVLTFSREYRIEESITDTGQPTFAFLNSFGAFDCIWMNGLFTEEGKNDNINYFKTLNLAGATIDKSQFSEAQYARQPETILTANSGWINLDHFKWLFELVKSPVCYQVVYGELRPIVIDDVKWSQNNEATLYNVAITYRHSVQENYTVN